MVFITITWTSGVHGYPKVNVKRVNMPQKSCESRSLNEVLSLDFLTLIHNVHQDGFCTAGASFP